MNDWTKLRTRSYAISTPSADSLPICSYRLAIALDVGTQPSVLAISSQALVSQSYRFFWQNRLADGTCIRMVDESDWGHYFGSAVVFLAPHVALAPLAAVSQCIDTDSWRSTKYFHDQVLP